MDKWIYKLVSTALIIFLFGCKPENNNFNDSNNYFGQQPTDSIPLVFAPGIISFGNHEHHLTFMPDYTELFYVIADKYRKHHIIITMKRENGRWLDPEVAPFSGNYSDFAPTPSPDGKYLLFCTNRPLPDDTAEVGDFNIWKVNKNKNGWSTPEPLPFPVNDETNEYNPTIASNGNLYFQDHDNFGVDIYFSEFSESKYSFPVKLPSTINTPYPEIGPWISPNDSILWFSSDRPDGFGGMDIYYSKKDFSGNWLEAINLGEKINSPYGDAIPTLSPDQKQLFFVSFRPIEISLKNKNYSEIISILNSPENGDGAIYFTSIK